MIRFDQVLSRLTIACLVVWVIVFGLKLFCEWTAIRMLAFANESLKGKKSNVLFERAPILPDRITFSSAVPDTIVFGTTANCRRTGSHDPVRLQSQQF